MDEAEYCESHHADQRRQARGASAVPRVQRSAIPARSCIVEGDDARAPCSRRSKPYPRRATSRRSAFAAASCVDDAARRPAVDRVARLRDRGSRLVHDRVDRADARDVFVRTRRRRPARGSAPMKLRRVRAIAEKEIIQVLRDPRSLIVVLLMPLMQIGAARIRRRSRHQERNDLRFRPEGGQQSQSLMKRLPGGALFRHRRSRARLQRVERRSTRTLQDGDRRPAGLLAV